MRSAKSMLVAIERCLPRLSRREWAAIAIEAARRAGLEKPDIASLRIDLRHQFAVDATGEHGTRHHDRSARRSPRGARVRRIPCGC